MIRMSVFGLAAMLLVPVRMPVNAAGLVQVSKPDAPAVAGVAAGAKVHGAPFAVWADADNDGRVDGYVANGAYVRGTPPGYRPEAGQVEVANHAAAELGTVAATPHQPRSLKGPVIGAPVAGKRGAVWADINADGQVDGYVYRGQYHSAAPQRTPDRRP